MYLSLSLCVCGVCVNNLLYSWPAGQPVDILSHKQEVIKLPACGTNRDVDDDSSTAAFYTQI